MRRKGGIERLLILPEHLINFHLSPLTTIIGFGGLSSHDSTLSHLDIFPYAVSAVKLAALQSSVDDLKERLACSQMETQNKDQDLKQVQ